MIRILLVMALMALSMTVPVAAQNKTPLPSDYKPAFITLDQMVAPRLYGVETPRHRMLVMLSPSQKWGRNFLLDDLKYLNPYIANGQVQLDLRIFAHNPDNIAIGVVASCLDLNAYTPFLTYVAENFEALKQFPYGLSEALVNAVARNKLFWPKDLNEAQVLQRLVACQKNRSNFILAKEQERLQARYMYNLKDAGPYVILDGKSVLKVTDNANDFTSLLKGL